MRDRRPSKKGGDAYMSKSKSKPMTKEAAERIQSHADKTGTNQDFKARAQSAVAKNKEK